jgi:hypothetical protein
MSIQVNPIWVKQDFPICPFPMKTESGVDIGVQKEGLNWKIASTYK